MHAEDLGRTEWDAIVVGSGLGGLACAAALTALGKRTLVLEGHIVAGGNAQVFRRRVDGVDVEFDVGVHYIGECGPDGTLTQILHGLGLEGRLRFRQLDPDGYSTLVFPDRRFRVPASWELYRRRLLEEFPDEAEPLGRVVDLLREIADAGRRLQRDEASFEQTVQRTPAFFEWGLRPASDLFAHHGLSPAAAACLVGEQGTYAVPPSRAPVALVGGLTDHYMRGAYYPEGGGQVIASHLVEAIVARGGDVRTRARVERILVDGGRAVGVRLAGGRELRAPVVVSNADVKRTLRDLVGREHLPRQSYERVMDSSMAPALFCVYLLLDTDLGAQGVPNTNFHIWSGYDSETAYEAVRAGEVSARHGTYITVTSLKDPGNRRAAPEGWTNLQVMTLAPSEARHWGLDQGPVEAGNNAYHRDARYKQKKAEAVEALIDAAEAVLPPLRPHIRHQEACSPMTHERFTRSTGGTSYGLELTTQQIGPLRVGARSDLPGLFFCGASTQSAHGIVGVLRGGVATAGAIVGEGLLRSVMGGERLGGARPLGEVGPGWDAWRAARRPL